MNTSDEKRKRPGPTKVSDRPIYLLRLRPEPRVDSVRALRRGLKLLFRQCRLRCLSVREEEQQP
jgi:hypothetical protein